MSGSATFLFLSLFFVQPPEELECPSESMWHWSGNKMLAMMLVSLDVQNTKHSSYAYETLSAAAAELNSGLELRETPLGRVVIK